MKLDTDPRNKSMERRVSPREHCSLSITMRERGESAHTVEMIELSESGCAIDGSPVLGGFKTAVWVKIGEVNGWRARFVWTNGKRTGLEFDEPLHCATVERILNRHQEASPNVQHKDAVADGLSSSRSEQIRQGYAELPLLMRKKRLGGKDLNSLIERKASRCTEHRHESRYPIEYATAPDMVEVDGAELRLRDIAPSGIGLDCAADKRIGEELQLQFPNCEAIDGRVVWKTENRTGIALGDGAITLSDEPATA